MRKSTGLEIKTFDLNSKMKNMLDKYKSKGLNYQDAYISDVADQLGGLKENIKILSNWYSKENLTLTIILGVQRNARESFLFWLFLSNCRTSP